MQQPKTYKGQSRIFITQAFEELEKGDLPQASEKGWGAAAQIVKAICEDRGWRHFSHRDVMRTVDSLSIEADDPELRDLFAYAGYLHVNFYENAHSVQTIRGYLKRVVRFVDKADTLLGATAS